MTDSLTLVPFGWPVVIYLTLAGMAAGTALLSALGLLRGAARWRRLGGWGLLCSAVAIASGAVFLVADLEAPARFWLVLTRFNPASAISWGVRILLLFTLFAAFAGWATRRPPQDAGLTPGVKLCVVLVALLALAVGLYPAWVLLQATARPLWASPWIAPLFLVSALHSGVAVLGLGQGGSRGNEEVLPGRRFEIALIATQAVLLTLFLLTAFQGYDAAAARLTRGDLAAWLWVGVVAIGWLVPLALSLTPRSPGHGRVMLRSCAILLGALSLRAIIVLGGQGGAALLN